METRLAHDPIDGDLGRGGAVAVCNLFQQVNQRGNASEQSVTEEIPAWSGRPLPIDGVLAGEEALGHGAVGNECHAILPTGLEHSVPLGLTVDEGVLNLIGGEGMAAALKLLSGVSDAVGIEIADANGVAQFFIKAVRKAVQEGVVAPLLERKARPMLLVESHPALLQPPKALPERFHDAPSPKAPWQWPELCCHLGSTPAFAYILTDEVTQQCFGQAVTVHFRRVNEPHSVLNQLPIRLSVRLFLIRAPVQPVSP